MRHPEVDQHRSSPRKIVCHKDIGWLDVGVHDTTTVDVIQGVGNLGKRGQALFQSLQPRRFAAVDELHRQPMRSVRVDLDDVGMAESTRELEFAV